MSWSPSWSYALSSPAHIIGELGIKDRLSISLEIEEKEHGLAFNAGAEGHMSCQPNIVIRMM